MPSSTKSTKSLPNATDSQERNWTSLSTTTLNTAWASISGDCFDKFLNPQEVWNRRMTTDEQKNRFQLLDDSPTTDDKLNSHSRVADCIA